MAVAVDEMVVDHADRLHEGVDDRRADEIAAALAQILGDRLGDCGRGRHLAHRRAGVLDRPALDEAPDMPGEAAARLVKELGLDSNLVQLDAVPYHLLHHVYGACDVYVTPAYVETFAHPLVEAMAAGLPVIASDLAAHREVCGDAALYFPKFSPEMLTETICRVERSGELREKMAKRGLERSADFSWKHHVAEIVSIAEALVQGQTSHALA